MTNGPKPTDFIEAPKLSQKLGWSITFISELRQYTHSFKFRAAWNLVQKVAANHFIAASSGNFGQALAKACQINGRKCTVIMPTSSSKVKIAAVQEYGAEVVFVNTAKQSRAMKVSEWSDRHPEAYIASAYDCQWVIEGNSSLGFEIAQSGLPFDAIIAPVGGGGLSAGLIQGLCHASSSIPVWGAEPLMANDGVKSLRDGTLHRHASEPQTLADGARTASLGNLNFRILRNGVAGMIEVPEESIVWGLQSIANEGLRVEPTGALSVGALRHWHAPEGAHIGCVLSGGNVDKALYDKLLTLPVIE
ncbi:MAG: threonine ammonia-lyase [Myxococcota bacterium]